MYCTDIDMYVYVYVRILMYLNVYACIRLYMYIYACISINLPALPRRRRAERRPGRQAAATVTHPGAAIGDGLLHPCPPGCPSLTHAPPSRPLPAGPGRSGPAQEECVDRQRT